MLGNTDFCWVPVVDDRGYKPAFVLWNYTKMSAYVAQKPDCVSAFVFGDESNGPPCWQVLLSHKRTKFYKEFEKVSEALNWASTLSRLVSTGE